MTKSIKVWIQLLAAGVLAFTANTSRSQAIGGAPAAHAVQGDTGVYSLRVIDEPGYRALRNYAEPGATRRLHRHDDVAFHLFVVLTGAFRFTTDGDDPRVVGAGDIIEIPPGVEHTFTNIGNDTATFVEVFGLRVD